jgi:hypothetical protein
MSMEYRKNSNPAADTVADSSVIQVYSTETLESFLLPLKG